MPRPGSLAPIETYTPLPRHPATLDLSLPKRPTLSALSPPFLPSSLNPHLDRRRCTDEATAASAVRNLASVEVHGRNLRVELSSDNQGDRQRGDRNDRGRQGGGRQSGARDDGPPGGYGGPGGYGPPGNAYGGPQMGGPGPGPGMGGGGGAPPVDLGMLPQGKDAHGGKATDAISATLAAVSPGQMQDVMAGMKVRASDPLITSYKHQGDLLLLYS